jgi:hypothetical protein
MPTVWQCDSLKILEPSGPVQAKTCITLTLLLLLRLISIQLSFAFDHLVCSIINDDGMETGQTVACMIWPPCLRKRAQYARGGSPSETHNPSACYSYSEERRPSHVENSPRPASLQHTNLRVLTDTLDHDMKQQWETLIAYQVWTIRFVTLMTGALLITDRLNS